MVSTTSTPARSLQPGADHPRRPGAGLTRASRAFPRRQTALWTFVCAEETSMGVAPLLFFLPLLSLGHLSFYRWLKGSQVRSARGPVTDAWPRRGGGVLRGLRGWEERVCQPPSSGHPVRGPQAAFWWPLQESWWGGRPWTKAELRVQLVGGFGGQRSCLGRRGLQGGACHRGIPALDSLNGAAAGVLWAGVELSGSGGQTGQVAAPLRGGGTCPR